MGPHQVCLRTSLMVCGCKCNQPSNPTNPSHKQTIPRLNEDFRIISCIYNTGLESLAVDLDHRIQQSQRCYFLEEILF